MISGARSLGRYRNRRDHRGLVAKIRCQIDAGMGDDSKAGVARELGEVAASRTVGRRAGSGRRMIKIVNATAVEALGGFRLRVTFSDGASGVHDFADIVAEVGPMVEPLREASFFQRVFISLGVLTWPNGYDIDSILLHSEMKAAGELTTPLAAE